MEHVAQTSRRSLVIRDSLMFATLTLIAAAMYGITSLLFHSFEKHREVLGREWIGRAQQAMAAHRAEDAVTDLRNALSFVPDDRENTLLLAEALSESGRTDEAANYYLGLWEQTPGDGPINLRLARVTRQTHQVPHFAFHGGLVYSDDPSVAEKAINYYRAAIYGTWPDRVVEHRYETRTELVDYLLGLGRKKEAHEELTTLAGRLPESEFVDQLLAEKFAAADDADEALRYYTKAATFAPKSLAALKRAADFAFQHGRFVNTAALLKTLDERSVSGAEDEAERDTLRERRELVARILALDPDVDGARDRQGRLRADARLAQQRLAECLVKVGRESESAVELTRREHDWKALNLNVLLKDAAGEKTVEESVFETYRLTKAACGKSARVDDEALMTLEAAKK